MTRHVVWKFAVLTLFFLCHTTRGQSPGTKLWEFTLNATGATVPAVATDGTLYVGTDTIGPRYAITLPGGRSVFDRYHTNRLQSLDSAGNPNWDVEAPSHQTSIGPDGDVHTVGVGGDFITIVLPGGRSITNYRDANTGYSRLNAAGVKSMTLNSGTSLALGSDGTLFGSNWAEDSEGLVTNVFATTPAGTLLWQLPVEAWPGPAPVIGPDSTLYYCTIRRVNISTNLGGEVSTSGIPTNSLIAIRHDGGLRWRLTGDGWGYAAPSIGADGTLYVAATQYDNSVTPAVYHHGLDAITPAGHRAWRFMTDDPIGNSVIGSDGTIYVAGETNLYALTPGGTELWRYPDEQFGGISPALAADGTLYAVTKTGRLLAIDSDGDLAWEYTTSLAITNPPTIGPEGNVYILPGNTNLVAIQGSTPPADSPWPQYQHDAQRTGRAPQRAARLPEPQGDGTFLLPLVLEPGRSYRVQASPNLVDWTTLSTFTSDSAAESFLDTEAASHPQRFYRVLSP